MRTSRAAGVTHSGVCDVLLTGLEPATIVGGYLSDPTMRAETRAAIRHQRLRQGDGKAKGGGTLREFMALPLKYTQTGTI